MIITQDRSGWFGASDTNTIMCNWHTTTFARFWLEKLGILVNDFTNIYMLAGTYYEHQILDYIGADERDRQIKIDDLLLRVNLDGETPTKVQEVKTHKSDEFNLSLAYWRQAQVEMFATGKELEIVSYQLLEEDYQNFFNPIDPERLDFHPIEYDKNFIENEYLPRLRYLKYCLNNELTPKLREVESWQG